MLRLPPGYQCVFSTGVTFRLPDYTLLIELKIIEILRAVRVVWFRVWGIGK